jgi:hypothetical protein
MIGLSLNEHRESAGSLHVARRLRDIKNELGLSHEELAGRTGLPLDRIKTYFSLFGGSESLLTFLDQRDVPLKLAIEFVRYEKATNEGSARKLTARRLKSPLSVAELMQVRRRLEKKGKDKLSTGEIRPVGANRLETLLRGLGRELQRDRATTMAALEKLLGPLGYYLVPGADAPAAEPQP